MIHYPEHYYVDCNHAFPNSNLPVVVYRGVLKLPFIFPHLYVRLLFRMNNWGNSWSGGISNTRHYHSNTHEALGVYKGESVIELGGEDGLKLRVRRGDVLIIPAGVAHRNLGQENAIEATGAYPDSIQFDMYYGKIGERAITEKNVLKVPIPHTDPVAGFNKGVPVIWTHSVMQKAGIICSLVKGDPRDVLYKLRS